MKKSVSLFVFIMFFVIPIRSQTVYPQIGSTEWKKLKIRDKIASCQIDENELKMLSTSELVNKCLKYTFILSIFYFDDFQKGFEHVKRTYNGLSELFSRNDAAIEIYNSYCGLKADQIDEISLELRPGSYD